MEEIWKPVVGFESRYEVSNRGRIRAIYVGNHGQYPYGRILKVHARGRWGYLYVTLWRDGLKSVIRSVHSVVTEAFHGPKPTPKHECRHLDGTKQNNFSDNLKWGTKSENREDSRRHGTITNGERNGFSKLTELNVIEIRRRRERGESCQSIANDYGVDWSNVWLIGKRKTWRHVP